MQFNSFVQNTILAISYIAVQLEAIYRFPDLIKNKRDEKGILLKSGAVPAVVNSVCFFEQISTVRQVDEKAARKHESQKTCR